MRRIIAASLFLSTVLLPAQTVTKGQGVTLEARSESPTPSLRPLQPILQRTSAPPNLHAASVPESSFEADFGPSVSVSSADFHSGEMAAQHVVVSFKVDENGVPQNLHLVKSVNPIVDSRILSAVAAYRFEPGTLDDQKVAVDVNLVVNFQSR